MTLALVAERNRGEGMGLEQSEVERIRKLRDLARCGVGMQISAEDMETLTKGLLIVHDEIGKREELLFRAKRHSDETINYFGR